MAQNKSEAIPYDFEILASFAIDRAFCRDNLGAASMKSNLFCNLSRLVLVWEDKEVTQVNQSRPA